MTHLLGRVRYYLHLQSFACNGATYTRRNKLRRPGYNYYNGAAGVMPLVIPAIRFKQMSLRFNLSTRQSTIGH